MVPGQQHQWPVRLSEMQKCRPQCRSTASAAPEVRFGSLHLNKSSSALRWEPVIQRVLGSLRTAGRSECWIQADFSGKKRTRWRRRWGSILCRNRSEDELRFTWYPREESKHCRYPPSCVWYQGMVWPPASGSGMSSARCAEVPLSSHMQTGILSSLYFWSGKGNWNPCWWWG